jgi:hypothetical protein
MPKAADVVVHAGALCIGALGTLGVFALSIGMNAQVERVVAEPVAAITTIEAQPAPKAAGAAKPKRTSPVKKARAKAPSASPLLAASLAGLDFGLDGGADDALSDATAALVGEMGAVVLDEAAVEEAPVPTSRTPPSFPARARALGQTGHVTVSFAPRSRRSSGGASSRAATRARPWPCASARRSHSSSTDAPP